MMNLRKGTVRFAALLLTFTLAAAACGDDDDGAADTDVVVHRPDGPLDTGGPPGTRPLLRKLVDAGERVDRSSLTDSRDRWRSSRAELPRQALQLSRGTAAVETVLQD